MPETMAPPMAGPAPGGAPPPAVAPGPTGPATVAPDSQGLQMRGKVQAIMAMKSLTQALGLIGAETPEGMAIVKALQGLGKTFGDASPDLTRQEAKLQMQQAPPVSQPTPQQGAAFQKMASMGMKPGAAPPPGASAAPQAA